MIKEENIIVITDNLMSVTHLFISYLTFKNYLKNNMNRLNISALESNTTFFYQNFNRINNYFFSVDQNFIFTIFYLSGFIFKMKLLLREMHS